MDVMTLEAWMQEYPEVIWAIIAAAFLIIEVGIATGIGFFFAAMAALTMAILLVTDLLEPTTFWYHVGWFFLFTSIWAVVLWRPVKKWFKHDSAGYDDMIGTRATLLDPIEKHKTGNAKWSGTQMRARVADDAEVDRIAAKTEVFVVETEGSVLLVDVEKR